MPGKSLTIDQLDKNYGETSVLKNININAEAGEFLVLVGPSGCGKSTLLNCIAGLEETSNGLIHIGATNVTHEPPKDRDIAMVFQSYALYPTMSVYNNMAFGMKVRGIDQNLAAKEVNAAAKILQIENLLDRKPSQLSGGQRQRVAMGRALVRDPALFLFDEPLSNLDAKLRLEMRAEIKRLHQSTNASIVYVTHDQVEAMTLASKIIVLNGGHVQQAGTPAEIYQRPANAFVAQFMGSPPMNICSAEVNGQELTIDEHNRINWAGNPEHLQGRSKVLIGMRPEHFSDVGSTTEACVSLSIQPNLIEHTGTDQFILFELNQQSFTARISADSDIKDGRITQHIPQHRLYFFDADTEAAIY